MASCNLFTCGYVERCTYTSATVGNNVCQAYFDIGGYGLLTHPHCHKHSGQVLREKEDGRRGKRREGGGEGGYTLQCSLPPLGLGWVCNSLRVAGGSLVGNEPASPGQCSPLACSNTRPVSPGSRPACSMSLHAACGWEGITTLSTKTSSSHHCVNLYPVIQNDVMMISSVNDVT